MAKTTEQEWVKIIIDNWNTFNKPKIGKEDIYKNSTIMDYRTLDDHKMSISRKAEKVYRQQIGNIVSHENKAFNFIKINNRTLFWPKKLNDELSLENNLGNAIKTKTSKRDMLIAIKEYEKGKNPKITTTERKEFSSSQTLKKALKVIHKYSCELDCDMQEQSFLSNKEYYVEVHHLIPLKNQINFENNLDIIKNMVVLCPKHHKMFHFGSDENRKGLINLLPKRNREYLKENQVTETSLFKMY